MKRWRSVLFTPATRIDRVEKAWASGAADVVVADLEDAVPPDGKAAARRGVAALLAGIDAPACRTAVRINAVPGAWADDDIEAVAEHPPDLVVVPKAEDSATVGALAARLPDGVGLMLILETARGVLAAQALASVERVEAVALGAEDLAADAGMRRSAENAEVAVPRSLVALAAAAEGVAAIDMITADFRDVERTAREAREALGLGYAGKMCLHPAQVEAVHEAFTPTADEVDWARKVVDAVDAAGAGEGGVVVVEGRMVDVPLVRQARAILARQG